MRIVDGHNFVEIIPALMEGKTKGPVDRPLVVIARTVKGKGVSIFEGKAKYHGVAPSDEEFAVAMKELGE